MPFLSRLEKNGLNISEIGLPNVEHDKSHFNPRTFITEQEIQSFLTLIQDEENFEQSSWAWICLQYLVTIFPERQHEFTARFVNYDLLRIKITSALQDSGSLIVFKTLAAGRQVLSGYKVDGVFSVTTYEDKIDEFIGHLKLYRDEGDWFSLASEASKLRLALPPLFIGKMSWVYRYRDDFLDYYLRDKDSLYDTSYLANVRILFKGEFKPHPSDLETKMGMIERYRQIGELESFWKQAYELAILAADHIDVNVSDGLALHFDTHKTVKEEVVEPPVRRNF